MRILRAVIHVVFWTPILLLGSCVYREVSQRNGLASLCEQTQDGSSIDVVLETARKTPFTVRTVEPVAKDDREWFDREYARIGKGLEASNDESAGHHTVIFAKPGIGFYACVIVHRDDIVSAASFLDNSS